LIYFNFAGYTASGGKLLQTQDMKYRQEPVVSALRGLFESNGGKGTWNSFVKEFFSAFPAFLQGYQNDSAKAFEHVIWKAFGTPDPSNKTFYTVTKAFYTFSPLGPTFKLASEPFVVYGGQDGTDAIIVNELVEQDKYESPNEDGTTIIHESEFLDLPAVLFLVGTCAASIIVAAKKGLSFQLDKPVTYSLVGASLHSGTPGGGHYTALVKHNNIWFSCSDASVNKITSIDIVSESLGVQMMVFKRDI
jgi:hypothetical protein